MMAAAIHPVCGRAPVQPIPREQLWVRLSPDGVAHHRRVRTEGQPYRGNVTCPEDGSERRAIVYLAGEIGRTGTLVVPANELFPTSPTSLADEAEYDRLDALIAGTRGDRRQLHPFHALRLRSLIYGSERLL